MDVHCAIVEGTTGFQYKNLPVHLVVVEVMSSEFVYLLRIIKTYRNIF